MPFFRTYNGKLSGEILGSHQLVYIVIKKVKINPNTMLQKRV